MLSKKSTKESILTLHPVSRETGEEFEMICKDCDKKFYGMKIAEEHVRPLVEFSQCDSFQGIPQNYPGLDCIILQLYNRCRVIETPVIICPYCGSTKMECIGGQEVQCYFYFKKEVLNEDEENDK